VLDAARVLVLHGLRAENPPFYPMLAGMGFSDLPDFSQMVAITFCDVVVSHVPLTGGLLFHELVPRRAIPAGWDSAIFGAVRPRELSNCPIT
jgi:hypothetical protein